MKNTSQQNLVAPMKSDKGVAGLTILLSVVAMVFIIGFLVMVFAIIGSQLQQNVGSGAGNTTAINAINATTNALVSVTTWFPIIITITVMVALILLTVIIIVAIRSSGILANGQ